MQLTRTLNRQHIQEEILPQPNDRLLLTKNQFQNRMIAVFVLEKKKENLWEGIIDESLNGYQSGDSVFFTREDFDLYYKLHQGFADIPSGIFYDVCDHYYYQCEEVECIGIQWKNRTLGVVISGTEICLGDLDHSLNYKNNKASLFYCTTFAQTTELLTIEQFFDVMEKPNFTIVCEEECTLVFECEQTFIVLNVDPERPLITLTYMRQPLHYENSFLHSLTTKNRKVFQDRIYKFQG